MATIDLSKLAAIPYFDLKNLAGRTISSLTFHDAGEWHMWVNAGDQLIKMQGFPSEAAYFAKEAADPNDFCSHFLDFMAQQACFPEVTRAVFGIHDARWGEAVHAVVVPRGEVTVEELIAHCRALLGGFKVPRDIELRDQPLPKSGAGKLLKTRLREPYWDGHERMIG